MKIDTSNIERQPDIAFDTPIGTKVILKVPSLVKPVSTVFLGMEKDRYLLLRFPRALLWEDRMEDDPLTVEYMKENLVFGFSARVLHTIRTPFPLLFLEYPHAVERLDLRHDARASCFLSVVLYWQSEQFPGYIIDLSRGDCQIVLDPGVAATAALEEKGSLFSQFRLNDQEDIYARCQVKKLATEREKLFLGVEFHELPEEVGQRIESYVHTINEFRPGGSGSEPREHG